MVKIEIRTGASTYVRNLVPAGTDCYIVSKRGRQFLNVRTNDPELLAELKAAAR